MSATLSGFRSSLHTVSPQVYVVELTRKPLFPGIYTPVHVSKNEKLIKEIMETKKQGSVLRDHWQHRVWKGSIGCI